MAQTARPALFLDRDGVININHGYVSLPDHFEWIAGAKTCIATFNARNWYVFIVTNQSGIARGLYSEADMHRLHDWMSAELARHKAHIDHIYFCPFHPEGNIFQYQRSSPDRKPAPGMILRAFKDFHIDEKKSFLIGDKLTDIEAAQNAGIKGYLFSGGNLAEFADQAMQNRLGYT